MGNWKLIRADEPRMLTRQAMDSLRHGRPAGMSRRTLLRRSLGAGVGLWLLEVTGGTVGFLWPNLAGGFGSQIVLGDMDTVGASPQVVGTTLRDGAPSYFQQARAFVQLVDPNRGFQPGESSDGEGTNVNVRAMYQRCPHLGCKPNFCTTNYWFECPCHGSRYDRLGSKIQELGPAPRGLDRFAVTVDGAGVLTVDTSKITLGPLPIAAGGPGLIPPKSPTGCL
jgi:cytochrome b6-f complex iron-sulfur subunit